MKITCSECGGEEVEFRVILLEPLKDKKDGTGGRAASVSEDAELTCKSCGHMAAIKLPEIRGQEQVYF